MTPLPTPSITRLRRCRQINKSALVWNRRGTLLSAESILKRILFEMNPRPPSMKLGRKPKPSRPNPLVTPKLIPSKVRIQLTVVRAWQQNEPYPLLPLGKLSPLLTLLTANARPRWLPGDKEKRQPVCILRPLQPLHFKCIHLGSVPVRALPLAQVRTTFVGTRAVGTRAVLHLIVPPSMAGGLISGSMPIPEVLTTLGPHLRLMIIAWPTAALRGRARVRVFKEREISTAFVRTHRTPPTTRHTLHPNPLSSLPTTSVTLLLVRQPRRRSNRHRCVLSPPLTVIHILDRRTKSCVS